MWSSAAHRSGMAMYIRVNKRRISVRPSSTEDDIFRKVTSKLVWPKCRAYFEFQEDKMVEISNDDELRLACRVLSEHMYNESKGWSDEMKQIEDKVRQHMVESDSECDEKVCSEDDITMEDFYMMGFRHEICN
jgi:hypothetical protein